MSERIAAPSDVQSTGSLDDNPVLYVLSVVFAAVLGGFLLFAYLAWQEGEAEAVLKGPAKGAAMVYHDRSGDLRNLIFISVDIRKTRAPGAYLRALQEWQRAGHDPIPADKAAWVYELEKAEHKKVQALLISHGVTLADIKVLESKLSKISPQLTDAEAEVLEKITAYGALNDLGWTRNTTVKELFRKLNDMGASDTGLRELNMYDPLP